METTVTRQVLPDGINVYEQPFGGMPDNDLQPVNAYQVELAAKARLIWYIQRMTEAGIALDGTHALEVLSDPEFRDWQSLTVCFGG